MKNALVLFVLVVLGGCSPENGTTAGKEFCDCVKANSSVSTDARVNYYNAKKICEGIMIKRYPLYRVFAVDMIYADTAARVNWAEREKSTLFMLEFGQYVNANCKEFN